MNRGTESSRRPGRERGRLATALVVIASVGAATAVRLALDPLIDDRVPYMLYLSAVVVSAWWGGWRAGAVSTALSIILATWLFSTGGRHLGVPSAPDWLSLLIFLSASALLIVLLHRERAALAAVVQRDARLLAESAEREALERKLAEARRLESIGRLAGGVAHDFNNLLAAILGSAQLLKPSTDDRELVDTIETSAERGAALVRQLLGYAGRQMLLVRPVRLAAVVDRVGDATRRILPPGIELRASAVAEPWVFDGDDEQVGQLVSALLANALDAVEAKGGVELRIENRTLDADFARQHPEVTPGEYVQLTVLDDGPGLSAEARAHLFEPFFTTRGPSRAGLGLASVYGLVKQMHGHVFIESRPGHGVRVDLYWPRSTRDVFGGPVAEVSHTPRRALRVLLVEDQDGVRETVRRMVEQLGHTVTTAANGVEAFQAARGLERIDLLLTDIVMPWMNGRQLADHLAPLHPDMRVVMMTGYSENSALLAGAMLPGATVLKKPFSAPELIAALSAGGGREARRDVG